MIHPAGQFTYRDLVSVLPMLDETTVLKVTGQQLLDALENGVSQYPKLEGRFPQVNLERMLVSFRHFELQGDSTFRKHTYEGMTQLVVTALRTSRV